MDADCDEWYEEPREAYKPPSPINNRRGRGGGGGRGRGGGGGFRSAEGGSSFSRGRQNDGYKESSYADDGWDESNNDGGGGGRGRGGRSRGGGSSYPRGTPNNGESGGWEDTNADDGWEEKNNSYSSGYNDSGNSERRGKGRGWGGRGGKFSREDSEGGFDGGNGRGRGRGRNFVGEDWDAKDGASGNDFNNGFGDEQGGGSWGNNDGHRDNRGPRGRDGERGEEDEKPKERYIPPEPSNDESVIFGSTISSGINFDKYDSIQVKVSGENVPKPVSSFEECQLRNLLLENVKRSGYKKPTPVQKHALPIICDRRDLMACAQTGSGKTAAFLVPIINTLLTASAEARPGKPVSPQVVICSPTRELSIQIFQEARKFAHGSSLRICIAYGGTVAFQQSRTLMAGCNILVATPGRLNDFVNKGFLSFSEVQFFVLDEADRMLDMGFLPAIEAMLEHETMTPLGQRQTLMFSATFPDDIQRLASQYLHNYLFLAVGIVGGACADVEQIFYEVSKFDKRQKLMDILSNNSSTEKELTLVFVEKKRTADFIAAFLSENNFPTTSIHGDRLQSQREEALADFKSGRMPILVATAVAARGLDIRNVAHVINFDLPNTIEEYVHRIGRTGRVGNRGRATSFFDPNEDASLAAPLVRILEQTGQEIPVFLGEKQRRDFSGGYGGRGQDFGGQDLRGKESLFLVGAQALEQEEEWS